MTRGLLKALLAIALFTKLAASKILFKVRFNFGIYVELFQVDFKRSRRSSRSWWM